MTDTLHFKRFLLKTGKRYRRDTAKTIAEDFSLWREKDIGPSEMARVLKAWGAPYSKFMHGKGYWTVTDVCPKCGSHMEKSAMYEPYVCSDCSHSDRLIERMMGRDNKRRRTV